MSDVQNPVNKTIPPRTPTWVKALGVVALLLVLLLGVMFLSGGEHGPGRHLPVTSVTEAATSIR
jgi:hypothetical protein